VKVIVDAMGGDHAPEQIVAGAAAAAADGIEVILVGRGEEILQCLKKNGSETLPKGMEIANADDVVQMDDEPTTVLRIRKNASMVVGLRMLAEGEGDAFVSAGNTGALLTAATLTVKRLPGVRRAALCPVLPAPGGGTLLMDAGANAECTPEFLLQFALMGSCYAERMMGKNTPRIGLLSNGTEVEKGTPLVKAAHGLLQTAAAQGKLNFIGNVEARDALSGNVDVLVTDGFSGNVLLKTIEGTGMFFASELKKMFYASTISKLGALCCKSGIQQLKNMMDYRQTGGTLFIGLTRPVIKAHGSSDALAIQNAIRQAAQYVEADVVTMVRERMEKVAEGGKNDGI
jgi:glycerol-3-phosphate acyltransferase PlsX